MSRQASVLIIDNNPEVLSDLKDIFKNRGYIVYTANTIRSSRHRVNTLLSSGTTVDFALVSDRIPRPAGQQLSSYVQDRLGVGVQKLISPDSSEPTVDYEDLKTQWTKEMRVKELDFKYAEKSSKYHDKHKKGFWTFSNGVKKVIK